MARNLQPLSHLSDTCREPYGFWLDSALLRPGVSRVSLAGHDPFLILRSRGHCTEVWTRGRTHYITGDPFEALRLVLDEQRGRPSGGAVGYFAYDLKRFVERTPDTAVDDLHLPEMYLCFYEHVARFDPAPLVPEPALPASARLEPPDLLSSNFTRESYRAMVLRALEYIVKGDIYQANLSQRFHAPLPAAPFETYLALRRQSPAPFAAYLNYPEVQVLSASPERFLRLDPSTRIVETRPIKGTRRRGRTPEEDADLAAELMASEKDRAENVMVVDLERNDLGRVAEIGSVRVSALCELETYATVHHLTSTVTARLRADRDEVDLLRATFPGGSITGAPKVRAMSIIDELEPTARSVYTGAIGYIGFDGSMDLSIAIRTMLAKGGIAYFQAGGGIVADSDPQLEYEETLHKASALARVLLPEGEFAMERRS